MTAETLALFIAGIAWPFVFQWLNKFGLKDRAAQWAAVVAAFAIAVVAHVLTGGTLEPEAVVQAGSPVALLALLVYRQVIKPAQG